MCVLLFPNLELITNAEYASSFDRSFYSNSAVKESVMYCHENENTIGVQGRPLALDSVVREAF